MQAIWVNPSAGTLPTATKDGYIFAGWFDGNGNRYISTSTVTGNLVLYAKWVTSPLWIKTARGWERFLPPGTTVENIDYVWKFTGGKWQKIQPVYIRSNGQWIQLKGK